MVSLGTLSSASLNTGNAFARPPVREQTPHASPVQRALAVTVPIRSLGPRHGARIAAHLLALGPQDRYLRFGYCASDAHIERYVASLNFERDEIFGIYNRRLELIAMAHLAFSADPARKSCAEFGVSVLAHARGRGYGARLFERAVMHSRNEGVDLLFIHALSENTAMLNIARKAGASVERDGAESDAYLKLAPADLDSRLSELVGEQLARTDYRFKVQAKWLRDLWALLEQVRRGVRQRRYK